MSTGRKLDYETGLLTLTEQQEAFLDWLTGDREPGDTQKAFAARIGATERTLQRWKKDPSFVTRWHERMVETHSHPDTLALQLERLNKIAASGRDQDAIKAIDTYWRLVDKMSPQRVQVDGPKAVEGMSDEDLASALEAAAKAAAKRARPETPQETAERVRRDLGLPVP